mmetsp:Transcript_95339/g.150084  ORF Transcript_95339/g.150084 Transcript_95339/m.150084 type:complete len:265 (-) Transcript_95339:250-1044(-)
MWIATICGRNYVSYCCPCSVWKFLICHHGSNEAIETVHVATRWLRTVFRTWSALYSHLLFRIRHSNDRWLPFLISFRCVVFLVRLVQPLIVETCRSVLYQVSCQLEGTIQMLFCSDGILKNRSEYQLPIIFLQGQQSAGFVEDEIDVRIVSTRQHILQRIARVQLCEIYAIANPQTHVHMIAGRRKIVVVILDLGLLELLKLGSCVIEYMPRRWHQDLSQALRNIVGQSFRVRTHNKILEAIKPLWWYMVLSNCQRKCITCRIE